MKDIKLRQAAEKYGIPAGAMRAQFKFDRVGLWQLSDDDGADTFKGSKIIKADMTKKRDLAQAPRGVIVSAGLTALDRFRSHGVEVGDVVWFVRLSPWRRPVDVIDGKEVYLLVLRDGDIIAKEDDEGEYIWDATSREHVVSGQLGDRMDPDAAADY